LIKHRLQTRQPGLNPAETLTKFPTMHFIKDLFDILIASNTRLAKIAILFGNKLG